MILELEQILNRKINVESFKPLKLSPAELENPARENLLAKANSLREIFYKGPFSKYCNRQKYFEVQEDNPLLYAIIPKERVLIHKGLLVNGYNNLESMKKEGIFGNPSKTAPTYLSRKNKRIIIENTPDCILAIDTQALSEKRSIFIDPETITILNEKTMGEFLTEKVGDSYFVCHGIPAESIIEILYGRKIARNHSYKGKSILKPFINFNPEKEKIKTMEEYEEKNNAHWQRIMQLAKKIN